MTGTIQLRRHVLRPVPFRRNWRSTAARAMISVWAAAVAWSQTVPSGQDIIASPAAVPLAGPQVLSVSAYAAYYSSGLPETGSLVQFNSSSLPPNGGAGGSIVFGWSKFTERTTFSLSYSPSYTADIRYSSLDALNHAFSFNISRKLTPRWILTVSTAANYSTLEQFLFEPSALSNVASVPSSFSQLSSALLSGTFTTNQQLGIVLNTPPLVQSPLVPLLYGQRMLAASAQSTLFHSVSPHLSMTFSGGGSRAQYVPQNQTLAATASSLLASTSSGTAGALLSYSLSPVWQVGGTLASNWLTSSIENLVTTTSLATFGRTFAKQWVIQFHGGLAFTNPISKTSFTLPNLGISSAVLPVFGGNLAFKASSNTILGSFDRTASDSYGLGASSTDTASVTWQWRHLGRRWSLQSNLIWQQLQGNGLTSTSGWRAMAGVNRSISPHLAMSWQYTYLRYSGGLQGAFSSYSESAIRIATFWTPRSSR